MVEELPGFIPQVLRRCCELTMMRFRRDGQRSPRPNRNARSMPSNDFVDEAHRSRSKRRRTVLTSPEFAWAVELLQYLRSERRQLFSTADHSPALWPSKRGGRLTLNGLGRSITAMTYCCLSVRAAGRHADLEVGRCGVVRAFRSVGHAVRPELGIVHFNAIRAGVTDAVEGVEKTAHVEFAVPRQEAGVAGVP
jgi:hypothetical protein